MNITKDLLIDYTRRQADRSNRSCLAASLVGAAITTGSRLRGVSLEKVDRVIDVDGSGVTPPGKLFSHLKKGLRLWV